MSFLIWFAVFYLMRENGFKSVLLGSISLEYLPPSSFYPEAMSILDDKECFLDTTKETEPVLLTSLVVNVSC